MLINEKFSRRLNLFWYEYFINRKAINLKVLILLPLAITITIGLSLNGIIQYYQELDSIDSNISKRAIFTEHMWKRLFEDQLNKLKIKSTEIVKDRIIEKYFALSTNNQEESRLSLLSYTAPLYVSLKKNYNIFYFNFIDINRNIILRSHNPQIFGDKINRSSLINAERSKQSEWGIEIGRNKTFNLRVVTPWFINGKLLGYLELGIELFDIVTELHEMSNFELLIVASVPNDQVETIFEGPIYYKNLKNNLAVIYNSQKMISQSLQKLLSQIDLSKTNQLYDVKELHDGILSVNRNDHNKNLSIHLIPMPLKPLNVQYLSIVMIEDLVEELAATKKDLIYNLLIPTIIFLFIFAALTIITISIEKKIRRLIEDVVRSENNLKFRDSILSCFLTSAETTLHKDLLTCIMKEFQAHQGILVFKNNMPNAFSVLRIDDGNTNVFTISRSDFSKNVESAITKRNVILIKEHSHIIAPYISENLFRESSVIAPLIDHDDIIGFVAIGFFEEKLYIGGPKKLHMISRLIASILSAKIARDREEQERKKTLEEKQQIQLQLLHSSKLATIGTLVASIAHEINNPLMIIKGFNNLLLDSLIDANISTNAIESIKKQEAAMNRIATIVDGLRIFSRSDSSKIDEFKIQNILSDSIVLVETIFKKDGISIEKNFKCDNPVLKISSGKLQQVIMNLLSNAKDAIKESEKNKENGKIILSTTLDHKTNSIIISVADNGIGIAQDKLDRIFEAFYTTKPEGKGTGLGLSISQSIVEEMGGTLSATSTPGQGTTFYITLKLNIRPDSKDQNTISADSGTPTKPNNGLSLTNKDVLIIDDEEDIRLVLKNHLKSFGLNVHEAFDAIDGLDLLKKNSFDFVITDQRMPKMSGLQLISEAKKISHLSSCKFIIISGGAIDSDLANSKIAYDGMLKKPFSKTSIKALLIELCDA